MGSGRFASYANLGGRLLVCRPMIYKKYLGEVSYTIKTINRGKLRGAGTPAATPPRLERHSAREIGDARTRAHYHEATRTRCASTPCCRTHALSLPAMLPHTPRGARAMHRPRAPEPVLSHFFPKR
ncbi:hypothetical protein RR46_13992 [Papilio xuthus]|uniref:Uncharacterized protein n=1 Tax=Papilio xuthus TaxID=66420 RepID=A0A194PH88_PAPXU|nr:hypothetical protein RR46_13992 [Papilio xuthus]